MAFRNTLLLTPTRPGRGSVGEIFLSEMCRMFPRDRLVCFAAVSGDYEVGLPDPALAWLPISVHELPLEHVIEEARGKPASQRQGAARLSGLRKAIGPLANLASAYALDHRVELLWAVAAGPAAIELALAVRERTKLPLVTLVWDPIDYVAAERGFTGAPLRQIEQQFERLVRLSARCAVASDGMAQEIELKYGVQALTMIHSPARIVGSPIHHEGDEFRIGFGGSLYANDEFRALVNALRLNHWRLGGRPVHIISMGNYVNLDIFASGRPLVYQYLGFREEAEAVDILSTMDLLYLPYWFDKRYSSVVRQSFPNKMSLYLAAGAPVFFHGPEDSSPTRFMERYPVGVCCHSTEPRRIMEALESTLNDAEFRPRAQKARLAALDEYINENVFRRQLHRFLNFDTGVAQEYSAQQEFHCR